MNIRQLTTSADMHAAGRLAYEVYVRECGILGHLADHAAQTLTPDADSAVILGAFEGEQLLGTISMFFEADAAFPSFYDQIFELHRFDGVVPRDTWVVMTRLIVHPRARAGSLLLRLFTGAWAHAQSRGTQLAFVDCQPHLLETYRRLGFRSFAPAFDYGDSGLGIPLVAVPADHQHLREIRSLSLKFVDPTTEDPELAARVREILAEPGDPIICRRSDPKAFAEQLRALIDPPPDPRSSPFAGFCAEELEDVLGSGYILECARGIKLITADQNTRTVYVVIEGELRGRRGEREFVIGRGEMLGELAYLTGGARTADIYVESARARVLCLDPRIMTKLSAEDSPLGARFLRNLSITLAGRLVA